MAKRHRPLDIYLVCESELVRRSRQSKLIYMRDAITALMSACDMNSYQAEQCANILTSVGAVHVYTGKGKDVLEMYKDLSAFGLTVELRSK